MRNDATAIGIIAVILWSLLAFFTVGSSPVPPFQLNAMCFTLGGAIGLIYVFATGSFSVLRKIKWHIYLFGTLGLFGYHALYFSALRLAPPAEAGLIAYLWPLLIVLFSGFLPNESLKHGHIIGALISFAGAGLLISQGDVSFKSSAMTGYLLALVAAVFWAGYSIGSRFFGDTHTACVAVFCLATALLSTIVHLAIEETVWPTNNFEWFSILGLGLGPVGLAFYVWDIGVKKGDIQLLGVISYAAPLLSTLVLISAGMAKTSSILVIAAVLITAGALTAAHASSKP